MSQQTADTSRVLVVDDEPSIRRLIARLLTSEPYDLTMVGDAEAALAAFEEHTFDLAILDVVMPDMKGSELAVHLRKAQPGVAVLYVSGYDLSMGQSHGVEAHEAFLHKPFSAAELIERVQQALAKRGGQ
jgi:DNA-binding response OmpR family regulator